MSHDNNTNNIFSQTLVVPSLKASPYAGMTPKEAYEAGKRAGAMEERMKDFPNIKFGGVEQNPYLMPYMMGLETQAQQTEFVSSLKDTMPEGVKMASALDKLGMDTTKVQEDGSLKVNMGIALTCGADGAGFVTEDGKFDKQAFQDTLTTPVDNWSEEQKGKMQEFATVLQNLTECGVKQDGTPLKDTPEGQVLESFTSALDSVDEIKALQQDVFANKIQESVGISKDTSKSEKSTLLLAGLTILNTVDSSDVVISKEDLEKSQVMTKMEELAKEGQLTTELADVGLEAVGVTVPITGLNPTTPENEQSNPNVTEVPVDGTVQEEQTEKSWFEKLQGLVERDGKGVIIDVPGEKEVYIGLTSENQKNGKLFDFVQEEMGVADGPTTQVEMSPEVKEGYEQYQKQMEAMTSNGNSVDKNLGQTTSMEQSNQRFIAAATGSVNQQVMEQTVPSQPSTDRAAELEVYEEKFAREAAAMQME